ncbi:MAG: 4Fe-4S binding protein [Cyclobacteriaceae bacterium]|nr:4Fe-4S binding protein [Cyclobacteriaceae bacterium]
MDDTKNSYWRDAISAITTLGAGLKITLSNFFDSAKGATNKSISDTKYYDSQYGIAAVQYPKESIPIPDNGRYRLHNEINDCIVCDKCAKICPVDCIEIEPIKALAVYGTTSDGTSKRIYPARFDIDMGKCCYCGLCTTVCPTECLTMTKVYDFSEFDVENHKYAFSVMTSEEIEEKKNLILAAENEKNKVSNSDSSSSEGGDQIKSSGPPRPKMGDKPVMGGKAKVVVRPKPTMGGASKGKPVMKPKISTGEASEDGQEKKKVAKPVFKVKPKIAKDDTPQEKDETKEVPSKPAMKFKPKIKPVIKKKDE